MTGESPGSGTNSDFATIKYKSSLEEWIVRYNNSAENKDDYAHDIAFDSVFVTIKQEKTSQNGLIDLSWYISIISCMLIVIRRKNLKS